MNLNILNAEINRLLDIDSDIRAISRNLFIYYGGSFSELESFFNQSEFTLKNERIKALWRWLDLNNYDSTDNIREKIKSVLMDLNSVQSVSGVLENSIRHIISSTIQIFIIFDLLSHDGIESLKVCLAYLEEVINEFNLNLIVKKIGILQISKVETNSIASIAANDIDKLYDDCRDHFDKLFIIQCQNKQNLMIINDEEWKTLISILLSYLSMLPARMDMDDYLEWIKRQRPSDNRISAFSAKKFILPIFEIAKYVLLLKGSELLKETYFHISDEQLNEFSRGIVANVLTERNIEDEDKFAAALMEEAEEDIINPIAALDEIPSNLSPDEIIQIFRTFINKLDDYYEYNKTLLSSQAQDFYENYGYILTNILDKVLNSYKGAASIALSAMEDLVSNIEEKHKKAGELSLENPNENLQNALNRVQEEAAKEPPLTAIILRLIPFSIVGLILIIYIFPLNIGWHQELFWGSVIVTLGTIVLGLIQWHGWKNRFIKAVTDFRIILYDTWRKNLNNWGKELYGEFLPKYISKTNSFKHEIEELCDRLKYVFDFTEKHYEPKIESNNTFVSTIIKNKKEMEFFKKFVQDDFILKEPEKVLEQKLVKLWWRLSDRKAKELNPMEQNILEKAALGLIPYSNGLFQYSLCNYLNEHDKKKSEIYNQLLNLYSPFVMLDPNKMGSTHNHAVLRWKMSSCINEKVIDKAIATLKRVISMTELKETFTNFCSSVISFEDGIKFQSIKR